MIEVAFSFSVPEMIMYKGLLDEAGVECVLLPGSDIAAVYSNALSEGVRLMVHEVQLDKAMEILEAAGHKPS